MRKIIGFFGGDSQVGTTMAAQSLAEVLKERGKKVLFILGSGKSGNEFLNLPFKHSIDDLKATVRSGRVTGEELAQTMEECRGLYVIPAVRNPLSAKYFPENTYEVMLEGAAGGFDYIIIDGGNDANLGLTISALNTADYRFFVTTQQLKSINRMLLLQKNILGPLNLSGKLVINKYLADPALMMKKDIQGVLEMEDALTLPYVEYGWQAEMEGRSLMHFGKFAKGAARMADEFEPEKEGGSHGKRVLFRRIP